MEIFHDTSMTGSIAFAGQCLQFLCEGQDGTALLLAAPLLLGGILQRDLARLLSMWQKQPHDAAKDALAEVLDGISEGVVVQRGFELLYINQAALRLNNLQNAADAAAFLLKDPKQHPQFQVYDCTGAEVAPEAWPSSRAARGEPFQELVFRLRHAGLPKAWTGRFNGQVVENGNGGAPLFATIIQDITEEREAQLVLEENIGLLQAIHDRVPLALLTLDPASGRITMQNAYAHELLGYSDEACASMCFSDILDTSEEFNTAAELLEESQAGIEGIEAKLLKNDGSTVTVFFRSQEFEAHGQRQILLVLQDVTAYLRTLAGWRESEQRFQAMLDACPDMVFAKDKQGRYIFTNASCCKHLGMDEAVMAGATDLELMDAETATPLMEHDRLVIENAMALQFEEMLFVQGVPRKFKVNKFPLYDHEGRVYAVCGIAHDVTYERRVEQSLRDSEQRYRQLLNAAQDAVYVYPVNEGEPGNFIEVNEAACKRLGYSREELLAMKPQDIFAAGIDKLRAFIQQTEERGELLVQSRHRTRDGREIAHEVSARQIMLNGQQCMLSMARDISARVEAEQALRQLNEELEQRVEERTRQLRLLATELGRVEQQERRRLAEVLHDHLQQLIAAARMRLGLARNEDPDRIMRGHLEDIDAMLDEAIQVSRSLTVELRPPILYEAGLGPALEWLGERKRERYGLNVTVILPETLPPADDDLDAFLYSSARELIFNVHKYAGCKDVTLELGWQDDDTIRVTVADKGRGFSPEEVEKKSQDGASGLFSIRERLMGLGGALEVESTPGQGARISMLAAIDPAARIAGRHSDASETESAQEEDGSEGKSADFVSILLVDDHRIMREGLANMLGREPRLNVVAQASNGEEAIAMARQWRPDVILMDINMPGMNGIAATRQIKAEMPEIAILGLSVQDETAASQAMCAAGAAAYFCKGDDPRVLMKVIFQCASREKGVPSALKA